MAAHPFTIVPALTAIAVAYKQKNLIADMVFPRVAVMTEAFRYIKYAINDDFKIPDTLVGRKSAPNQLNWGSSEVNASTQDHGLDSPIPASDQIAWQQANAAGQVMVGQVDPESYAAEQTTKAVQNRREYRAATLATTLGNYAAANRTTLSGTSQWSDKTNSDPLNAILAAKDGMVMTPNYAWCGRAVATQLRLHPKIVQAALGTYTTGGIVPMRAVADILEFDDIFVGDAWIDTAAPGQAASLSRAWGKDFGMFYRDLSADTRGGVTFGFTAQWGDKVAGVIDTPFVGLRGGRLVRSGESVIELITANDLGYLFKAAVA